MSHHRDEPASFLDELFPGEGPELALTPRSAAPAGTRTSAAFGGREVGPPVSRLAPAPAATVPGIGNVGNAGKAGNAGDPGDAVAVARPCQCPRVDSSARRLQE